MCGSLRIAVLLEYISIGVFILYIIMILARCFYAYEKTRSRGHFFFFFWYTFQNDFHHISLVHAVNTLS